MNTKGAIAIWTKPKTLEEAQAAVPWAVATVKVGIGFLAFSSRSDYETWKSIKDL